MLTTVGVILVSLTSKKDLVGGIDELAECITDFLGGLHCPKYDSPLLSKYLVMGTRDIKVIINEKKRAFRAGNREGVRTLQGDLKMRIREAKEKYRKKLE